MLTVKGSRSVSAVPLKKSLRIAQISDCHLGEREGDTLLGMDTDHSANAVIEQLRAENEQLDLLVVSGDVSSDGHMAAYYRLQPRLAGLAKHIVWLPGNHDDAVEMRRALGEDLMPSVLLLDTWQCVFLNSAVPGQVGGHLADSELAALRSALKTPKPTLVFMHHHLFAVGCAWLDEQKIANGDALCDLLQGQAQVKALVCGHVHQQSDQTINGLRQLSTPSTCIQFAPNSAEFALDTLNPGYRCFRLDADGSVETQVKRVEGLAFFVDRSASGYQ